MTDMVDILSERKMAWPLLHERKKIVDIAHPAPMDDWLVIQWNFSYKKTYLFGIFFKEPNHTANTNCLY